MNTLREQTISLRQQGRSYNEINRALGVSKSTLSNWLNGLTLSDEANQRLRDRVKEGSMNGLIKRNKNQTVLAQ